MIDWQEPRIDLNYNRLGTAYILFGFYFVWGGGRGLSESTIEAIEKATVN